jgi:type III pantothenate kinase
MSLLVNVGNTRTVVVRGAAMGPLTPLLASETPRDEAAVRTLADVVAARREGDERVAVACVVPEVGEALATRLPGAAVVDHTWAFPFTHELRQPQTVGADRWCNVAAAVAAGLADALVVDAGTATTFDLLAGGVFLGGLIAPGMAFAARSLQETAALLWEVPFAPCELRAGRDTDEALAIGAFHVGVQGILGTVAALLERYPRCAVVVTGGLGGHVTRPGWRHDPDWTLRGLAALAAARAR